MREISFAEFQEIDIRIGRVVAAERIEGSAKLLNLQVDLGTERRQCVAGIAQHYAPGQIVGKKYMFLCNLERKRLMGVESQCMIFAAEDGKNIVLVQPEKDVEVGAKVK